MVNFLKENRIILIFILIYFLIFSLYSILRHYTFQTQTWDLAAFEQSFWNTIHGDFMFNTLEGQNHFAIHFSPWLILLVPFYAIWPSTYNLLILQSLALALGALPLYFLAKKHLSNKWSAVTVILYLLYPSLHWVNLFDFHAVSFAIPLILAAFYFLEKKQYFWLALFLILTASVEENIIVAVFFIGLYVLFFKNKKVGALISITSAVYFLLVINVFMPAFGGGLVRLDRYAQFGNLPIEIITNIFLKPNLTFQTIFTLPKIIYLIKIFLPVAFIPLLSGPTLILLIPGLLQNLLTNFESQFTNFYQYDSILIPFIFIGLILGLKKILTKNFISQKILFRLILIFMIFTFFWNSPLSPFNFPFAKFTDEKIKVFRQILKLIPAEASVAADTNLVPHLTHRDYIFMMGQEPFLVDYVIIDNEDIVGFSDQKSFDKYLDSYRQSGQYKITNINNRYFILVKQ